MYQRNKFPPRISEKGLLNIFFSPNVHSYLRRLSFMISFYKVRMRIKTSKCRNSNLVNSGTSKEQQLQIFKIYNSLCELK